LFLREQPPESVAVTSGRSESLGILLGAAAGAVAGQAIDKDNVRCR
jgi:outer membrane lipoprotein SlyB